MYFIRVIDEIDFNVPLMIGSFQKKINASGHFWIQVRYEKMIGLCYKYGVIGHGAPKCNYPQAAFLTSPKRVLSNYMDLGSK